MQMELRKEQEEEGEEEQEEEVGEEQEEEQGEEEEEEQQQQERQQQQEQQQQQSVHSLEQLLEQMPDPSGLFFPVPVYLEILDDVLLLVCRLLNLLLPVAAAQQQPAQADSSSSETASNRSSSTANQASSSSYSGQEQSSTFGTLLLGCQQSLFEYCTTLSSCYMTAYAGMQPTPYGEDANMICCSEAPILREDAIVWFRHAGQMCQVLEAYVRAAANNQAFESAGVSSPSLAAADELTTALAQLIDPTELGLRGPLLQAAAAAGPGSKEQQQLHGLLRSILKWTGMMGPERQVLAEQLRAAVAVTAANMLLAACRQHEHGGGAAAAVTTTEAETAAESDRASSIAAAGDSSQKERGPTEQPAQHNMAHSTEQHGSAQQSTAAAAVLPHLPWLGVLGCCCLQWSQQLASLPNDSPAAAAAAAQSGLPQQRVKGVLSVLPEGLRSVWGTTVEGFLDDQCLVWLCIGAADTWLTGECSRHPELLTQSVPAHHLDLIIAAVVGCVREFDTVHTNISRSPDAPVPLAGYVQQLSALGEGLCSVPHKQFCNNPTCGNISGSSELQLVKGRSNTCSGCRTARYCSPECTRQHWKQHRPVCKALARTAAGAADTQCLCSQAAVVAAEVEEAALAADAAAADAGSQAATGP
jgi:hypothetical protein